MTQKKNNIIKITLLILGIAISIGIGIGIAKAQPVLHKHVSLHQPTLSWKELKAVKSAENLKGLDKLEANLLDNRLSNSLVKKTLLVSHLNQHPLHENLASELKNVEALNDLHGKLDLLELKA